MSKLIWVLHLIPFLYLFLGFTFIYIGWKLTSEIFVVFGHHYYVISAISFCFFSFMGLYRTFGKYKTLGMGNVVHSMEDGEK